MSEKENHSVRCWMSSGKEPPRLENLLRNIEQVIVNKTSKVVRNLEKRTREKRKAKRKLQPAVHAKQGSKKNTRIVSAHLRNLITLASRKAA